MTGEQIRTGLAALALLVAVTAGPVAAQEKGALEVEASEMEILDAENKTIFRGDVDALRDGDRIRSEVMVVTYVDVKQADGTFQEVPAATASELRKRLAEIHAKRRPVKDHLSALPGPEGLADVQELDHSTALVARFNAIGDILSGRIVNATGSK